MVIAVAGCSNLTGVGNRWDQYRGVHEPENFWFLRKQFLLQNHEDTPDHLLLCLSTTFASIKLFGCKYPAESSDLLHRYHGSLFEDTVSLAFRTLPINEEEEQAKEQIPYELENGNPDFQGISNIISTCDVAAAISPLPTLEEAGGLFISRQNVALQSLMREDKLFKVSAEKPAEDGPGCDVVEQAPSANRNFVVAKATYGDMLAAIDHKHCTVIDAFGLMEYINDIYVFGSDKSSPKAILIQTFLWCDKKEYFNYHLEELPTVVEGNKYWLAYYLYLCQLSFGRFSKHLIFHGEGSTEKLTKNMASERALNFLRKIRPTIAVRQTPLKKIKRSELIVALQKELELEPGTGNETSANPFAVRMMQAMGWKGGGLGRNEDGINAPITDTMVGKNSRTGLGYNHPNVQVSASIALARSTNSKDLQFEKQIANFLREKEESLFCQDIQFPSSFSKTERKIIHLLAQQMKLETESFGPQNKRHLVVSKKFKPKEIFQKIMANGGDSMKYKVKLPNQS